MDIDKTIIGYLTGSIGVEEKEALLEWLSQAKENRAQFREIYDLWLASAATFSEDTEEALAKLRQRIEEADNKPEDGKEAAGRRPRLLLHRSRGHLFPIAASIALVAASAVSGWLLHDLKNLSTVMVNRLATGAQGKTQATLSDGSMVWLNAGSTLEYPELFTGARRTVKLEGEALFQVTEDRKHPFVVEAGGAQIEVLGTRFLIDNHADDPLLEAVLVEGSVRIGGSYFSQPHTLIPGQLLTYDKQTAATGITSVDTSNYTNWTNSRLVFDNTPVADIVINLRKWYGVDIVAPERWAATTRMTFTVRGETLDEVMKYLSLTAPASFEWRGDRIHLTPKPKK